MSDSKKSNSNISNTIVVEIGKAIVKSVAGYIADVTAPLDHSNTLRGDANKLLPFLNLKNPSFFRAYLVSHIFHDWRFGTGF